MYVSPCISVCLFDRQTLICRGCGRTKKQKDEWLNYSESERLSIMKELGYGVRRKDRHETREERLRRYDRG